MSNGFDPLDPRILEYALTPGSTPDLNAITRAGSRRRRLRALTPGAAVAVILLIIGAVAYVVLADRGPATQPTGPIPIPMPTVAPAPSPTPLAFAVEDEPPDGRPAAGLYDALDGLRADGVTFETTTCPDGAECPSALTLTLTNTAMQPFTGGIVASVYVNGTEATGTGSGIQLAPGETRAVTIVLDPALSEVVTPGGTPNVYTWNWRPE